MNPEQAWPKKNLLKIGRSPVGESATVPCSCCVELAAADTSKRIYCERANLVKCKRCKVGGQACNIDMYGESSECLRSKNTANSCSLCLVPIRQGAFQDLHAGLYTERTQECFDADNWGPVTTFTNIPALITEFEEHALSPKIRELFDTYVGEKDQRKGDDDSKVARSAMTSYSRLPDHASSSEEASKLLGKFAASINGRHLHNCSDYHKYMKIKELWPGAAELNPLPDFVSDDGKSFSLVSKVQLEREPEPEVTEAAREVAEAVRQANVPRKRRKTAGEL